MVNSPPPSPHMRNTTSYLQACIRELKVQRERRESCAVRWGKTAPDQHPRRVIDKATDVLNGT